MQQSCSCNPKQFEKDSTSLGIHINININKASVRGEAARRGWRSQAEFVSASRSIAKNRCSMSQ